MKYFTLLLALLLIGCEARENTISLNQPIEHPGARFTVTFVGAFKDPLAYSNQRGIYTIKDSETGREYVGVSGIGISEIGSHMVGKTRHQDER